MWPNRQDAELSALARPHLPIAPGSPTLFSFLLDEPGGCRGRGNDALLDEQVTAPPAFRPEPALVEPEQIDVGREARPLADLPEHVDEPRELFRELVEYLGQPFVTLPCERRIGALAQRDVVVDVHEATSQTVTEKA